MDLTDAQWAILKPFYDSEATARREGATMEGNAGGAAVSSSKGFLSCARLVATTIVLFAVGFYP